MTTYLSSLCSYCDPWAWPRYLLSIRATAQTRDWCPPTWPITITSQCLCWCLLISPPPYAQLETLKCRVHNVSSKTSRALYGYKSRAWLFRTLESYSSHPLPGDNSPIFPLFFPLFLFPSPTWLSSQSTSFPPPSCSPSPFPFPLSFPCFLDSPPHFDYLYSPSSHVWYSLCIQLLILSKGSLSVIFFTSNILSFFLYLNIKQFILWSTTPVEKCIAVLLSYSHEVSPSR